MAAPLIDLTKSEKPIVDYWQFDDDASTSAAPLPRRLFAGKTIHEHGHGEGLRREAALPIKRHWYSHVFHTLGGAMRELFQHV